MPLFKSWEEWGELAGSGSRSFLFDTGAAILEGACNIYSKYPKTFPMAPYARGFIGGFCEEVGKPLPEPDASFTGGQCPDVWYLVDTFHNTSTNMQSRQHRVLAPVEPLYYDFAGTVTVDGDRLSGWIARIKLTSSSVGNATDLFYIPEGVEPPGDFTVEIVGVAREDGQEDNCGDPDPFPDDPPIDPADFAKQVTINNYDNSGQITNENDFNLNIPLDLDNNFKGCINVGGTQVCFDLSGFGTDDGGGGENNEQPGGEGEPVEAEEQEEGEEEEKEVEGIKFVLLTITTFPTKGKTIIHENQSNNTYFAGYFSWLIDVNGTNYRTEEVPIRKERMVFKAPDDATGYSYYTVNGAAITATEYVKPQENEE